MATRGITFHQLGSQPIVDFLIGLDSADIATLFIQRCSRWTGSTNSQTTPLGWTCVGDLGQIYKHNATTNFVKTYFVSKEAKMDELTATLCWFWEIDNSRIERSPAITKQGSFIFIKAEKSITFSDGQYQIAIPWKGDKLQLPDNYKMALNRLQNLERCLLKSPQMAVAYSKAITKYLEKDYIIMVEPSEKQPMQNWYLPHLTDQLLKQVMHQLNAIKILLITWYIRDQIYKESYLMCCQVSDDTQLLYSIWYLWNVLKNKIVSRRA